MNYWLLKSEPDVWSIDQQKKAGNKGAPWDGVRNYQARNNLKKMKYGDLCFFYHSNIGKEIVGIVEVIKEAFLDPTDKKKMFVAVIVRFKEKLKNPIKLEDIKKNRSMGSLYDLIEAENLNEERSKRPVHPETWHRARIIVNEGHVEHWLDNIKLLEYNRFSQVFKALVEYSKYSKWENFGQLDSGHILLQDHGDRVSFKNIKIREF